MSSEKVKLSIVKDLPPEVPDEEEEQISYTTDRLDETSNANSEKIKDNGGNGGDGMDQILRRIEKLEDNVNILRVGTATVEATLPALAKQEDLIKLNTRFETVLPYIATKEEVSKARNWIILTLFGLFMSGQALNYFFPSFHAGENSQMRSIVNASSQHKPAQG